MSTSSTPQQESDYPSFGPRCRACNRPDMSNMTWRDGFRQFVTAYLSQTRMWPIGYIVESAYSPLRLEREISNRNWRDAFEDLLALHAGRDMINPQIRKAEDDKAAEMGYRYTNDYIQTSNAFQRKIQHAQKTIMELRREFVEGGQTAVVAHLDEHVLPRIESDMETVIADAQTSKTLFEACRNMRATDLKRPGAWMISLITNGAVPGWSSLMGNHVDGPFMSFSKVEERETGISFSEPELDEILEGQEFRFGTTPPLPPRVVDQVTDGRFSSANNDVAVGLIRRFLPSASSILYQRASAQPIKLRDGSIGAEAHIVNHLADGQVEERKYLEEPGKVYEEVHNARQSMSRVRDEVVKHMYEPRENIPLGQEMVDTVVQAASELNTLT